MGSSEHELVMGLGAIKALNILTAPSCFSATNLSSEKKAAQLGCVSAAGSFETSAFGTRSNPASHPSSYSSCGFSAAAARSVRPVGLHCSPGAARLSSAAPCDLLGSGVCTTFKNSREWQTKT